MKTQIHSLPLGAAFGALNIAVCPVTLYTKQHYKRCFIRRYRQDEMKMRPIDQSPQISITQRRGLEKEWLSKLFGSCVCVCACMRVYLITLKVKIIFKGGVSDFWLPMLIFEITKTNTPLPQKGLAPILIAPPHTYVIYASRATISSVKQSKILCLKIIKIISKRSVLSVVY